MPPISYSRNYRFAKATLIPDYGFGHPLVCSREFKNGYIEIVNELMDGWMR